MARRGFSSSYEAASALGVTQAKSKPIAKLQKSKTIAKSTAHRLIVFCKVHKCEMTIPAHALKASTTATPKFTSIRWMLSLSNITLFPLLMY